MVCLSILALGIAALTVDFFSVRMRRSAGLPGVWPKLTPVVFAAVYTLCLSLLCAGFISKDVVREWNGILFSGAFATMATLSVLAGRPFVHADVIEIASVEQLRQWETQPSFMPIMNVFSGLWACTFIVHTDVKVVAMELHAPGYYRVSTLVEVITPWLIVLTVLKCILPRLIVRVRKQFSSDDSQAPDLERCDGIHYLQ